MMGRLTALSLALVFLPAARCEPSSKEQPVVMAPVAVNAGPLGYLGITFDLDVDAGLFSRVSDTTRIKAMVVAAITKGSPAEAAGLVPKDRVLRIDGITITQYTIGALKGIREKEKGDKAEFVVVAAGSNAVRTVDVIVGTRHAPSK
jgi:C-terminal processing protease CtpA/Prc